MQVSGFRYGMPQSVPAPRSQNSFGDFGEALQRAGKVRAETSFSASSVSETRSAERPDFTSMAPRQFAEAAQGMYDRGEIDLDHLFKMQFAAGGIFKDTPVSATESTTPVNYVEHFRQQLSAGSPYTDPYSREKIAEILNLIG